MTAGRGRQSGCEGTHLMQGQGEFAPPRDAVTVVIVDDHPIVLDGLEALVASTPDVELLARCEEGRSGYERIVALSPTVAIVNLRMPGMDGLSLLRKLREVESDCRVILFTRSIDEQHAMEGIRLGAAGILLKELPTGLILECIRKVGRGERWLEQATTARVLDRLAGVGPKSANGGDLTRRELQLVRLAAAGHRNRDIARRLRIKEGTVKVHLHNIYRKLGVSGRVQLALYAQSRGLD